MKRADLAEHFGDISLSAEELDKVAKQLVGGENFDKLIAKAKEFEKLRETSKAIKESAKELEQVSWKLSMGFELDEGDKFEYKEGIENFVEDSIDLVEKKAKAGMSLFEEDSLVYNKLKDFYGGKIEEMRKVGEQLKEAVNNGFQDGLLTIDEDAKIQELKDQLIHLQEEIAGLENEKNEAGFRVLELEAERRAKESGTGKLTADSANELLTKVNTLGEQKRAALDETYYDTKMEIENANLSPEEKEKQINEEHTKYIKEVNESYLEEGKAADALYFDPETGAYGKDLNTINTGIKENLETAIPEVNKFFKEHPEDISLYLSNFHSLPGVSELSKGTFGVEGLSFKNIEESFEHLKPAYEELKASEVELTPEQQGFINRYEQNLNYLDQGKNTGRLLGAEIVHMTPEQYQQLANASHDPFANAIAEGYKNQFNLKLDNIKLVGEATTADIQYATALSKFKEKIKSETAKPNFLEIAQMAGEIAQLNLEHMEAVEKSRELLKLQVEKPLDAEVKVNAKIKAGIIDNSLLSDAVRTAIQAGARVDPVVNAGTNKLSMGVQSVIQSINIPKFASGTDYSPDIFIAGEEGPELIVGGAGRKIFDNAETLRILKHYEEFPEHAPWHRLDVCEVAMRMDGFAEKSFAEKLDFLKMKPEDLSAMQFEILNPSERIGRDILGDNEHWIGEEIIPDEILINKDLDYLFKKSESSPCTINVYNSVNINTSSSENMQALKYEIEKAMDESSEKLAEIIREVIEEDRIRKMRLSND